MDLSITSGETINHKSQIRREIQLRIIPMYRIAEVVLLIMSQGLIWIYLHLFIHFKFTFRLGEQNTFLLPNSFRVPLRVSFLPLNDSGSYEQRDVLFEEQIFIKVRKQPLTGNQENSKFINDCQTSSSDKCF